MLPRSPTLWNRGRLIVYTALYYTAIHGYHVLLIFPDWALGKARSLMEFEISLLLDIDIIQNSKTTTGGASRRLSILLSGQPMIKNL
jgi:hypothetical protein